MTATRSTASMRIPGCTRWSALLLLWLLLCSAPALACRYNVRDVGFVDLETEPYRVCIFLRPELPTDMASVIEQMSAVAFRDCNIQSEIVAANAATNHPAFARLPVGTDNPLSHAVLLSPDGQILPLALLPRDESLGRSQGPGPVLTGGPKPDRGARLLPSQRSSQRTTARQQPRPTETDGLGQRLASVLDEIASSPKREELLTAVSRSFAAVLLIEGEEANANQRARQAIASACEALRAQMQSMPKAIAKPPVMVVLERAAQVSERVLLWSLGLDSARSPQPRAAIVYGRARWMGPLMQGDEISEANLTGLLSIIGADCECGLDVAWTLGTRLPVRWDEARHAQVAKALGFDPESPLVKIEVGRIAARSGSPRISSRTESSVVLSSDPAPATRTPVAETDAEQDLVNGSKELTATDPNIVAGNAPILRRGWGFFSALAGVVLSIGLVLAWHASRR